MFMEKVLVLAQPDMEERMLEKHKQDLFAAEELTKMIKLADLDNSGRVSQREFITVMQDPRFHYFFEAQNINVKDAVRFFEMMARGNEDTELDLSDMVGCCLGIRGAASAMDLHALAYDVKLMHAKQREEFDLLRDCLERQGRSR